MRTRSKSAVLEHSSACCRRRRRPPYVPDARACGRRPSGSRDGPRQARFATDSGCDAGRLGSSALRRRDQTSSGRLQRAMAFIRASNSSDCRTGLVRQAEISRVTATRRIFELAGGGQHHQPDLGDPRLAPDMPGRSSPSISGIMPSIKSDRNGSAACRGGSQRLEGCRPPPTASRPRTPCVRTSSRISRLVALSSTIKTGSPSSCEKSSLA